MTKDLQNSVLKAIKEKKICPKSRWFFVCKNYILWGVALIALIISGLSLAVLIEIVQNNGFDIYVTHEGGDLFMFFAQTLPVVWLVLLVIFVSLAYVQIRRTKHGYRYAFHVVVLGGVVLSLMIGGSLYATGYGQRTDAVLSEVVPRYNQLFNRNKVFWTQPEKGMVVGRVSTSTKNIVFIIDFKERVWEVDTSHAQLLGDVDFKPESEIRLIGHKLGENKFEAVRVGSTIHPRVKKLYTKTLQPMKKSVDIKIERKLNQLRNTNQQDVQLINSTN